METMEKVEKKVVGDKAEAQEEERKADEGSKKATKRTPHHTYVTESAGGEKTERCV